MSFISSVSLSENKNEIKIIMKINDQIVTNIDIKKEYNYLVALNNNLSLLTKEEGYKIAKDSLIREILKSDEIEKFIDLKNFKNDNLINNVLNNVTKSLKLKNILELDNYLNDYDISLNDLKNKMIKEVLWNQLVNSKYKNNININKKKLIKQIEDSNILQNQNEIQYELSEILFQVSDQDDLKNLTKLIDQDIQKIGFKNAANKYSIAETSKLGGYLGVFNETQLSNEIKELLLTKNIGEYTKPTKVGNNFLILYIDDKKKVKKNINKEKLLSNLIDSEKQKQFNNFSQIYFNKIKISSQIHEY